MSLMMPPEADEVPPAAADAAAGTEDPAGTARVAVRSVERGDRLRLLGRVEPTEEGIELVDGIVTNRGRPFLTLSAFVGFLQYLTAAVFAAAVGAAATWGAYASL